MFLVSLFPFSVNFPHCRINKNLIFWFVCSPHLFISLVFQWIVYILLSLSTVLFCSLYSAHPKGALSLQVHLGAAGIITAIAVSWNFGLSFNKKLNEPLAFSSAALPPEMETTQRIHHPPACLTVWTTLSIICCPYLFCLSEVPYFYLFSDFLLCLLFIFCHTVHACSLHLILFLLSLTFDVLLLLI